MRIGILTHHYVKNFGAYMQANALISVIREKYSLVDVEVVDYRIQSMNVETIFISLDLNLHAEILFWGLFLRSDCFLHIKNMRMPCR